MVNDQLDAQFFSVYLFQFSTCFEQPRPHHQENQLYQHNLWYMSLCVGDRFVCSRKGGTFRPAHETVGKFLSDCTRNGHRHRLTYTRGCVDTVDSPDDEREGARNM
jgi:hypothetical protein